MDISKLPRLSKTDAPPPPDPAAPDQATGDAAKPTGFHVVLTGAAPAGSKLGDPPVATPVAAAATSFCRHCGAPLRPNARFCDSCGAATGGGRVDYAGSPEPGVGAEVWFSFAMGLLLIFMSPRIWQYVFMRGSFTWSFQDELGNPLPYPKSVYFWGDVALAAFALTLIAEGIVIGFVRRRIWIGAALLLTVITTLGNLLYVSSMMVKGYGFQLYSGLAIAFGVYIALYEWKLYQRSRPGAR